VSVAAPEHVSAFAGAVADGRAGDRLWLYATYHCNLACAYCLTESHPRIADRRTLRLDTMVRAVEEAAELGFRSVGITGGEVFMLPSFPRTLVEIARILPTVALSNGTLFTDRMLGELEPLSTLDAAIQLSLDSHDPAANDGLRGAGNFAQVVAAIPRLRERGIRVRIATTLVDGRDGEHDDLEELCELHRGFGIPDEDHIVRGVVRRGRAATERLGAELGPYDTLPELTLTSEGVFLHPFAPTVQQGMTATDLRVGDELFPLAQALDAFLEHPGTQAHGADVVRNVR
jgi:MoaA/NifB/PqqE/SkfB family radical SAM enzyme